MYKNYDQKKSDPYSFGQFGGQLVTGTVPNSNFFVIEPLGDGVAFSEIHSSNISGAFEDWATAGNVFQTPIFGNITGTLTVASGACIAYNA